MCENYNNISDEEASNVSCSNSHGDSSDELFMDSTLSMFLRITCMGVDALSLVCLLLPYMLTDKAKGTILGKLMKSFCILSLLALLAAFLYTLMEFVIPTTNAACCITFYIICYALLASLISKLLFLFHVSYIFYCSYKMVLRDTTEHQIFRLKVGYFLIMASIPLIMIFIIVIHNHVLNEVDFTNGDRCLYSGDLNRFTIATVIIFIVCVHLMGILIIIVLTFLLRKAYQTQKAVGQGTKNLFRIALSIAVTFGMAWIVYAFQPLYPPLARPVYFLMSAVENTVIISVLFYNDQILTKFKMYIKSITCHKSCTVGTENV